MAAYSGYGRHTLSFEMQGALQVQRNLGALVDRLPWIQKRAIATVRRRVPVEARRDIQAEYNLPAARVRKDLSIRNTDDGLRLTGQFRGIGLRNFAGRVARKGTSSQIYRGGRREVDEGSFEAQLLGGNVQFVERYGEKVVMQQGRYKGKKRQRIEVLYGPTVAQMLGKGRRPDRLADYAKGVAQAEVERLLASYTKNPSTAAGGA